MNMIDAQCHSCKSNWRWLSGTQLQCPYCSQMLIVETPTQPSYVQNHKTYTQDRIEEQVKVTVSIFAEELWKQPNDSSEYSVVGEALVPHLHHPRAEI